MSADAPASSIETTSIGSSTPPKSSPAHPEPRGREPTPGSLGLGGRYIPGAGGGCSRTSPTLIWRIGPGAYYGKNLDWAGPWEVLSYLSRYKPEDDIEVFTVARDNSRPIECAKGLRVLADHSWDSAPEIDVLVYPGGSGTRALLGDEEGCAPGCARSTSAPA